MKPVLYIIVPCYNEEAALEKTSKDLLGKLQDLQERGVIGKNSRVLFVDDGSRDGTWSKIKALHTSNKLFEGIKLSRNQGHQNALLAGLTYGKKYFDVSVSIDADLQDDIDAIDAMLDAHIAHEAEIVYGVRNNRESDSKFKRGSAQAFYKLMAKLGVETVYNHADYRLMSRRAVEELNKFGEVNLFLRGIVPLLGFKSQTVEYKRTERLAGESKYPFFKMLNFAIDGITSFSVRPLRIVTSIGFFVSIMSLGIMLYSISAKLLGHTVNGWTFTIISVWFIGGIQMLSIGVVGEYIGKVYSEVKHRPRYIIEEVA